jgi:hypothetical protein
MKPATTALCRKPDDKGIFNPQCAHIIEAPRGATEPRQCRRAAREGTRFCDAHPTKDERD